MKRLAVMTAAVLLASAALCAFSVIWTTSVMNRAHVLATETAVRMEMGDDVGAKELLTDLAVLWDEQERLLEVLCDHEDLHTVKQHIIQAKICLEYADMEDLFAAVALIGEGLEHIRCEEALSWTNLL